MKIPEWCIPHCQVADTDMIRPEQVEAADMDSKWFKYESGEGQVSSSARLRAGELGLEQELAHGGRQLSIRYDQMVSWYDGPSRLAVVLRDGSEQRYENVDGAKMLCKQMKTKALHLKRSAASECSRNQNLEQ